MPSTPFLIDSARVGALAVTATTGTLQTVTPTPTWFSSSWSAPTALKVAILSGNLGFLFGQIRTTAGVTAGAQEQVCSLAFPDGISIPYASTAPIPDRNGFSELNTAPNLSIRFWANLAANTSLNIRMLITLSGVPSTLLPQPPP